MRERERGRAICFGMQWTIQHSTLSYIWYIPSIVNVSDNDNDDINDQSWVINVWCVCVLSNAECVCVFHIYTTIYTAERSSMLGITFFVCERECAFVWCCVCILIQVMQIACVWHGRFCVALYVGCPLPVECDDRNNCAQAHARLQSQSNV